MLTLLFVALFIFTGQTARLNVDADTCIIVEHGNVHYYSDADDLCRGA